MKKTTLLLIFVLVAMVRVCAQNGNKLGNPILPANRFLVDEIELRDQAIRKVSNFVDYLQKIVDRYPNLSLDKRRETREKWRQYALKLFIGQGKSFQLPNGRVCSPVEIEITSLQPKSTKRLRVSQYLLNLIGLAEDYYAEVYITNYDVMQCSEINEVGNGLYKCTVSFTQQFVARRKDSNKTGGDLTEKVVEVYLKIDLDKNNRPKIVAYLGDITAGETLKLNSY